MRVKARSDNGQMAFDSRSLRSDSHNKNPGRYRPGLLETRLLCVYGYRPGLRYIIEVGAVERVENLRWHARP